MSSTIKMDEKSMDSIKSVFESEEEEKMQMLKIHVSEEEIVDFNLFPLKKWIQMLQQVLAFITGQSFIFFLIYKELVEWMKFQIDA